MDGDRPKVDGPAGWGKRSRRGLVLRRAPEPKTTLTESVCYLDSGPIHHCHTHYFEDS